MKNVVLLWNAEFSWWSAFKAKSEDLGWIFFFFFNLEMPLSWLLGAFMLIPYLLSLCLWFDINGCSCCAKQSFHWMSISEAKFLPFLAGEARDPVSSPHTILQTQPPLPEKLLPHLSRGTCVILCWQTLDTPKYVRAYFESDVVSPHSRRQNTKLKQAGLKEKKHKLFQCLVSED